VAQIGLLVLVTSIGALAQNPNHEKFSGLINAYTAQTSTVGPYEVRGVWSLKLEEGSSKADFSAALTMGLSDGWVLTLGNANFDPKGRNPHTHHITLENGDVTPIANGFRVTGTATVTVNGGPTPFAPSPLQIDVTGGSSVEFSNITLTFSGPAAGHFGTQPLSGVVRRPK
jgi:hypothetical protein